MFDFSTQLKLGEKLELILDNAFSSDYIIKKADLSLQKKGIDRIFETFDGATAFVEYKSDLKAAKTGNAFIETISVDTKNIQGWVYTSHADIIVYFIPQNYVCYLLEVKELKQTVQFWKETYPTRKVPNKDYFTHGILVPLSEIEFQSFDKKYINHDFTT